MKKSTIIIIVTGLTLFLCFFIFRPITGRILVKDKITKEPADPISAFMMGFSEPETAKPVSLDNIEHIVINGKGLKNHTFVRVTENGRNEISRSNYYYKKEINSVVKGNTMMITLSGLTTDNFEIDVDSLSIKTIALNNIRGTLSIHSADSVFYGLSKVTVGKGAQVDLRGATENRETLDPKFQLLGMEKSIIRLEGLSFATFNATLNNARLDLIESNVADTANIALEGRSNIIHPAGLKTFGKLTLTGNTDYYNERNVKKQ
ncbi:hypothetical protein [Sphingobacterium hotanense]|uniref:hypothetical protein n=1 Tax=Sphingobacterium hotanense TaxID=649196 RepID=UPI0011F22182|nr:hypothetical protein [Sphingobacterium hotanense]